MSLTIMKFPLRATGTLEDANPVIVPLTTNRPTGGTGQWRVITVWTSPTPGDTIRVEYRCDSLDDWTPWPKGDVTTRADDVLDGPISDLRFTRIAGSGTTSRFGVA